MCPLLIASEKKYLAIVQLCIESHRANLEATDHSGKTALILAAERGNAEIVKALLHTGLINITAQELVRSLLHLIAVTDT